MHDVFNSLNVEYIYLFTNNKLVSYQDSWNKRRILS